LLAAPSPSPFPSLILLFTLFLHDLLSSLRIPQKTIPDSVPDFPACAAQSCGMESGVEVGSGSDEVPIDLFPFPIRDLRADGCEWSVHAPQH
jgi:hypothetical protein